MVLSMIIMIGIITDTDEKQSMFFSAFPYCTWWFFFIHDELDHSSATWMHQLHYRYFFWKKTQFSRATGVVFFYFDQEMPHLCESEGLGWWCVYLFWGWYFHKNSLFMFFVPSLNARSLGFTPFFDYASSGIIGGSCRPSDWLLTSMCTCWVGGAFVIPTLITYHSLALWQRNIAYGTYGTWPIEFYDLPTKNWQCSMTVS
jgi:hypothetical protein